MNTWQPISTAPKDGTPILVGWWTDRHGCPKDWNATVVIGCAGEEFWRLVQVGSYASDPFLGEYPTHWQPLPAEPEKPETKEAV